MAEQLYRLRKGSSANRRISSRQTLWENPRSQTAQIQL